MEKDPMEQAEGLEVKAQVVVADPLAETVKQELTIMEPMVAYMAAEAAEPDPLEEPITEVRVATVLYVLSGLVHSVRSRVH